MATSNAQMLWDMVKDFVPTVLIAYNNLLDSDGLYENIRFIKANHRATYFVEQAKELLSHGYALLALECFTRAITSAENDSKLSDCYNERAGFLKDLDYWEEFSRDIWRVLRCHTMKLGLNTVFKFLGNSLDNMRPREYSTRVRELPRIPDYEVNETFPCSTSNIRIVNGGTKGQHVVATSRLHISENIVIEKPLIIASSELESILFCHECMSFCLNPVPCSSCSKVAFCGEACKESAWTRYHKYECYIQYITEKHKRYRLTVKIALLFHDYIDVREDGSYCPEEYRYIMDKEYNLEDISDETKNVFASFAAQVFHGLRNYTTFFQDIKLLERYDTFMGLMMKLMLAVDMCQEEVMKNYVYQCEGTKKELTVYGLALYPFSSTFRTGCAANVSIEIIDTFRVVKTLRVIQPDEELFIGEEYHYAITPKEERQAIFQRYYSTVCKCEACENNWPLGKDLERILKSDVTFSLHMNLLSLTKASNLETSIELLHAKTKDDIGVHLVGPSLEFLYWQTFLDIAHRRLCKNCEKIVDFFRRSDDLRRSLTNRSEQIV